MNDGLPSPVSRDDEYHHAIATRLAEQNVLLGEIRDRLAPREPTPEPGTVELIEPAVPTTPTSRPVRGAGRSTKGRT